MNMNKGKIMGHYDSCREEFDKANEFLSSNPKEEQQFFVELRKVLYKLAKEKGQTFSGVLTINYNPPSYKGMDDFNFCVVDDTLDMNVVENTRFQSVQMKDIVNHLKSLQESEYPEEIMVKGRKFILVEDQYIPEENVPKIASREDRYNAVMKFDERIKRTGSSELEKK